MNGESSSGIINQHQQQQQIQQQSSYMTSSNMMMSSTTSSFSASTSVGIGPNSLSSSTTLLQQPQQQLQQSTSSNPANCIRVVCRFRPLTDMELKRNEHSIIQFIDNQSFVVRQKDTQQQQYSFDRTFHSDEDQSVVFQDVAIPIVQDFLDGYNGTILAYGQTASGKTYTIYGEPSEDDTQTKNGLIPRVIEEIFTGIAKMRQKNNALAFVIKMSCVELYMEKINDLYNVNGTNLQIREHPEKGIYVEGVNETVIQCPEDAFEFLNITNNNRAVAETKMSMASSRSHSILMIELSQQNLLDLSSKKSKLFLVDLAGSERASKTGAEGERMAEAKTINLSLSTLGTVINSLTLANKTHVPYRNSKLTRVLQESLGGNSKTTLIIACSPSNYNESETLSTIQFGLRAKKITNKPKINKEITVIELKQLLEKANMRIAELEEIVTILRIENENQKQFIDTLEKEKQEAISNQITINTTGSGGNESDELSLTCNKKLKRELSSNSSIKVRRLRDRAFKPMNLKDLNVNTTNNTTSTTITNKISNNPKLKSSNGIENDKEMTANELSDDILLTDTDEKEGSDFDVHANSSGGSKNESDFEDHISHLIDTRKLDEKLTNSFLVLSEHSSTLSALKESIISTNGNSTFNPDFDIIPINTSLDNPTPPISPRALPPIQLPSLSNSFSSMILPTLSRESSFQNEALLTSQPLTDSLNEIILSHQLEHITQSSTKTIQTEFINSESTSVESNKTTPSPSTPASPKPRSPTTTSIITHSIKEISEETQEINEFKLSADAETPPSPTLSYHSETSSISSFTNSPIKVKGNSSSAPNNLKQSVQTPTQPTIHAATKKTSKTSIFVYLSIFIVLLAIGASLFINPAHISDHNELQSHLYKLGIVNTDAPTLDQLKKSYKSSLLKYHPDKNLNCIECPSKFLEIQKSYDTLYLHYTNPSFFKIMVDKLPFEIVYKTERSNSSEAATSSFYESSKEEYGTTSTTQSSIDIELQLSNLKSIQSKIEKETKDFQQERSLFQSLQEQKESELKRSEQHISLQQQSLNKEKEELTTQQTLMQQQRMELEKKQQELEQLELTLQSQKNTLQEMKVSSEQLQQEIIETKKKQEIQTKQQTTTESTSSSSTTATKSSSIEQKSTEQSNNQIVSPSKDPLPLKWIKNIVNWLKNLFA